MDRNKLDQQMERRAEKLDLAIAARSDRKPLEEYERIFFVDSIYYEDALVKAKVILCTERLNGTFKGISLDTYGPWVLFKVIDIESGDARGNIAPGAVVLARWNNKLKVYSKYIYKEDPHETDTEVIAISSLVPASEYEIVSGKIE